MGRVFNSRSGIEYILLCIRAKLPNLELKTRPKQLLGPLPLAFALPKPGDGLQGDQLAGFQGCIEAIGSFSFGQVTKLLKLFFFVAAK
jgi:hypothetical protein